MRKFTLLLFSVLIAVLAISGCNFIPTLTTGSISGKVVDLNNNPINGATVSIPALSMTTTTNSTGNFTFAQVNYGTYAIHVEQTGYQTPADTSVTVGMNTPNPNVTITMTPVAQVTTGTVVVEVLKADNTPLSNATVTMGTYTNVTDANGKVTWQQVPANQYTVTAEKEGYVSTSKSITVTAGQTTNVSLTLNLVNNNTTGTVIVKVLQTDNAPISGATVSMGTYQGTTAADGQLSWNQVPAGNYTVNVTKDGYVSASKSITVTAGQTTNVIFNLVAENMNNFGTVTGVVVRPDYSPVQNATVKMGTYTATTNLDGRFTWNQVQPSNYTVEAHFEGFEITQQLISVFAGQTTDVVLVLKPLLGQITGIVTDAANQPLANVSISLEGTGFLTYTDPTGAYKFKNIPLNTYKLKAFLEGYAPYSVEIFVDSPLVTHNITLQTPPDGTLDDAKAMVNSLHSSLFVLGDIYVAEESVIQSHYMDVMDYQAAMVPYLQEMGSGLIHLQILDREPGVYTFSTYNEYGYPIYELVALNNPLAENWVWTVDDTFNGLHINISVPNYFQHVSSNDTETEWFVDFTGAEFLYTLTSDLNPGAFYSANILIGSSNVTSYDFIIMDGYYDPTTDTYIEVPVTYHVLVPSGNTATASVIIEPNNDDVLDGIQIGATLDLNSLEDRHILSLMGTIDTPIFHYYGSLNLELVGLDLLTPEKYRFFGDGSFVNDYFSIHGKFDAAFKIVAYVDEWGYLDVDHIIRHLDIHGGYDSPMNATHLYGSFLYDFTNFEEFNFMEPISEFNYEKHRINLNGDIDRATDHYGLNLDITRPKMDVANIHVIVNTPDNHIEGDVVLDKANYINFLSMTNQNGIGIEFDFNSMDYTKLGRVFNRLNDTTYANIVGIPGVVDILSINFVDGTYVQFPLDFWSYLPQ